MTVKGLSSFIAKSYLGPESTPLLKPIKIIGLLLY